MAYVNTIDWHIHLMRVDRFLEGWTPAIERALAYGATSCTLSRSLDDPNHFLQHSVWERQEDFDRYWQGSELQELRQRIAGLHNLLVLPHWYSVVSVEDASGPTSRQEEPSVPHGGGGE
jgi:quinol monooxygenase YgiN